MIKRIVLSGYGNVGSEFIKLIKEKKDYIESVYGLRLVISGVIGSAGCIYEEDGIDMDLLLQSGCGSKGIKAYGGLKAATFNPCPVFRGDILVEATATDINTGQPGLNIIMDAIYNNMNIVSISKGALVTNYKRITSLARERQVKVKYSGATAAALPTIDIGEYCLSGCRIQSIEGILNGTTNYILTKMNEEGLSFIEALEEAKSKGIAETDSWLDISGTDSACKILLLSNSLLGTEYSIEDVKIEGIEEVTKEMIKMASCRDKIIKLIARACSENGRISIKVCPEEISSSHLLFGVNGTNKGVIFNTDTMGAVAAAGGASNPRGAAAAALKDIINIYRE